MWHQSARRSGGQPRRQPAAAWRAAPLRPSLASVAPAYRKAISAIPAALHGAASQTAPLPRNCLAPWRTPPSARSRPQQLLGCRSARAGRRRLQALRAVCSGRCRAPQRLRSKQQAAAVPPGARWRPAEHLPLKGAGRYVGGGGTAGGCPICCAVPHAAEQVTLDSASRLDSYHCC